MAVVLRGCPPDSAEAAGIVDRLLEPAVGSHLISREELTAGLEGFTDLRIERYWQLTATINGWPPFPSHMPVRAWLLAALRCAAGSRVTRNYGEASAGCGKPEARLHP